MTYTANEKRKIINNLINQFGTREFRARECYTKNNGSTVLAEGLAGVNTLIKWGAVTSRTVEEPIPSAARERVNVTWYTSNGREVLRRKDVARDRARRMEVLRAGGDDAAVLTVTRAHLAPEVAALLDLVGATPRVEREEREGTTRTVKLYRVNPEYIEVLEREERERIQAKAAKAEAWAIKAAQMAERAANKAAALKAEADRLEAVA